MPVDPPASRTTYIVTGTTRGIGRALADQIVRRGCRLFTLNRRPDRIDGLQRNYFCDLSDAAQVRDAMARLLGAVDWEGCAAAVLINNAGVLSPIGPLDSIADRPLAIQLHTNLGAPIQLMSQFISLTPAALPARRIINITSGAADHAYAGWAPYCAAKAALNMITACVALEQAQRPAPVQVCAVAPGVVDTDMQQQIRDADPQDFPLRRRFLEFQAAGRLSTPQQVAEMILELDRDGQFQSGAVYDLRSARWENGRPTIAAREKA